MWFIKGWIHECGGVVSILSVPGNCRFATVNGQVENFCQTVTIGHLATATTDHPISMWGYVPGLRIQIERIWLIGKEEDKD